MKNRILTLVAVLALLCLTAVTVASCVSNNNQETQPPVDTNESVFETESETDVETDAGTATETQPETQPETETYWRPTVQSSELNELMQSIFVGTTVRNETVMFLDEGETKGLLYPIKEIVSVTSFNGQTTYVEGVDYEVVDGKLKVLAGSSIPCITSNTYNNGGDGTITLNGQKLYWGENQMQKWQINVNYTHDTTWEGYAQACEGRVYQDFLKKLDAGEDVTIIFYGDSITYGACSGWIANIQAANNGQPLDPTFSADQAPYSILFTQALADLFDYTVHYVDYSHLQTAGLTGAPKVPTADYVAGERGTITYINTSEGGENTTNAAKNKKMNDFLVEPATTYGCDLLVIAYGMNDGGTSNLSSGFKKIMNAVWDVEPECSVMMVSSMMPHPNAANWDGQQKNQEPYLRELAITMQKNGKNVAVACVNSVTKSILENKDFYDFAGNNINHPNDFLHRIYAQTLLQAMIGYENMQ